MYDASYYGGQCETVYNGEWRELRYDSACERLYYGDDEKYFRKPYNFLKYHFEVSLNRGAPRPLLVGSEGKPVGGDRGLTLGDLISCRACGWLQVPLHLPPHLLGADEPRVGPVSCIL